MPNLCYSFASVSVFFFRVMWKTITFAKLVKIALNCGLVYLFLHSFIPPFSLSFCILIQIYLNTVNQI